MHLKDREYRCRATRQDEASLSSQSDCHCAGVVVGILALGESLPLEASMKLLRLLSWTVTMIGVSALANGKGKTSKSFEANPLSRLHSVMCLCGISFRSMHVTCKTLFLRGNEHVHVLQVDSGR